MFDCQASRGGVTLVKSVEVLAGTRLLGDLS